MAYEPRDLPNTNGFRFIGRTVSGRQICTVVRDPETGVHRLSGSIEYSELLSWETLPDCYGLQLDCEACYDSCPVSEECYKNEP